MKKKILHIGKYFKPFNGGIENFLLTLMKSQVEAGNTVKVIVHNHQIKQPSYRRVEYGAEIIRMSIFAKLLFVPFAFGAFHHILSVLKSFKPDIVHAHLPNVTCFWLLLLPQKLTGKLILHWHSDVLGEKPYFFIKMLYPIYRVFEAALLKKADKIIVTSSNYLNSSKPLRPVRKKCVVIPLALVDTENRALRHQDVSNVGILCVGRLTYYKGHEYLIRALAQLDSSLTLTIVGSGEEKNALERLVTKLGVSSSVRFFGRASDDELNSLINSCSFLVLPSIERTEAFGLVLLEAMRASKACICSDVEGSGMSNVVLHEETGLVVKHANEKALAEAISTLSYNERLCEQYGARGRERFLSTYLIAQVERRIYQTYCNG